MAIALNEQEIGARAFKKLPLCPKCKVELGYRVRRGFILKNLFSWLPVKRYYCFKCQQKHYVWN